MKVTVPVELFPPTTLEGFRLTPANSGALTVRVTLWDEVPSDAVIVAVVVVDTDAVLARNVADFAPAATVTDPGKDTLALLEFSAIGIPPLGAAPLIVMVPVAEAPPSSVVGVIVRWPRVTPTIPQIIPQLGPFAPP